MVGGRDQVIAPVRGEVELDEILGADEQLLAPAAQNPATEWTAAGVSMKTERRVSGARPAATGRRAGRDRDWARDRPRHRNTAPRPPVGLARRTAACRPRARDAAALEGCAQRWDRTGNRRRAADDPDDHPRSHDRHASTLTRRAPPPRADVRPGNRRDAQPPGRRLVAAQPPTAHCLVRPRGRCRERFAEPASGAPRHRGRERRTPEQPGRCVPR